MTPAVFVSWGAAVLDLWCRYREWREARKAKALQEKIERLDAEDKQFIETGSVE
jgi:hypothetical protein